MANLFSGITSNLAQLKNFYQGPIVSQFNDELAIYRGAEKIKNSFTGQQVIRPLKVRRNPGIGATSDGGTLPAIGRQTTVQAIIAAKYNYLRFGVTGPMIKASQNDVGAFVKAATYELEEGYKDLKSDVNRQLSWDGTGWLARVNANVLSSPSVTVAGRESVEDPDKFLDVGLTVDIVTSAGTVVASGVDITAITGSGTTRTVTLSAPVSASSGNYLIRSGSAGQEIQGLLTQLDGATTTVFNVDRSIYPSARGNVVDLGSAAQLTLDQMQNAWNLGLRRGGAKYSALYCDFDTLRYYQKLLTADKRYSNTVKGDGGFASANEFFLEFNSIPVVPDKDCPQRLFFLPMDAIKAYVLSELEFADETGSMYIAQVSADALEVRVRLFMNLFNEKASASAVLRNYLSP